jgi:hypothetical protein
MLKLPTHNRYEYSSIERRPDYSWPGGKRLAFYVALNVEWFAFLAGRGADPTQRGGPQTQRNYAWRDYGLRVGIWRIFRMLDELRLPATHLLNSLVCEHAPEIIERIKQRGDDVCAHGRTNAETTEVIAQHFGERPTGWMGPGAIESRVTCDLIKEAGYTHSLAWPVDDQPIWMRTRAGKILCVPYPMELNDIGVNVHRDHTGQEFADMIVEQFEEQLEQSANQPLVMAVSLHTFITGQPMRLRPVRKALKHCAQHKQSDRVWYTRAVDIANYCYKLPPGTIVGG